jgi:2-oxoglutarate ferredoxin oxidoreductase subunit gamma
VHEVKLTGFGGQGVILAGQIIGRAATLGDKKNAVMIQSYGPESRGGACSAELIISEERILYPLVAKPDMVVAMSQEAYSKYASELAPDGILIIDQDLVAPKRSRKKRARLYAIPATRLAEELGRKIVANIVMLGALVALTGVISVEAAKDSILSLIPKGTEELNLSAFRRGYDYGEELLRGDEIRAILA